LVVGGPLDKFVCAILPRNVRHYLTQVNERTYHSEKMKKIIKIRKKRTQEFDKNHAIHIE
jgi:uncharacterized protein (UPF0335 family)